MKIVIFEPHPDDLLFSAGPIIFDWLKESHNIHIITVTDGRACYRITENNQDKELVIMPEDKVAEMRIKEAKKAVEFIGIKPDNLHLLYFHDSEGQKYVKEGIEKVKPLIKDADRIVLPSNNNSHVDHQATYDIAIGAAKEMNLDIEYWVYFILSYGVFKHDSKDKQINVNINDELRSKLQEWLQIYRSQKKIPSTWKYYTRFLKRVRKVIFGIFNLEDIGKYNNF